MQQRVDPAIWSYWESRPGTQRPPYLDACEATIRRFAGPLAVRVLDDQSVIPLIGETPVGWHTMNPVQRSDVARVRLVLRYGGIWVDVDTIAMAPLSRLMDLVDDKTTFAGYLEEGLQNGLFVGRRGAPLLREWADAQDALLARREPGELGFSALGCDLVTPLAERHDWFEIDHRLVAPIGWRDWRRFLSQTFPLKSVVNEDQLTVILYNAMMAEALSNSSVDELEAGHRLIGRILRAANGAQPRRSDRALEMLHPVAEVVARVRESFSFRLRRARRR